MTITNRLELSTEANTWEQEIERSGTTGEDSTLLEEQGKDPQRWRMWQVGKMLTDSAMMLTSTSPDWIHCQKTLELEAGEMFSTLSLFCWRIQLNCLWSDLSLLSQFDLHVSKILQIEVIIKVSPVFTGDQWLGDHFTTSKTKQILTWSNHNQWFNWKPKRNIIHHQHLNLRVEAAVTSKTLLPPENTETLRNQVTRT